MNAPSIKEVIALDGRSFESLSERDIDVLNYFRSNGRKHGIACTVTSIENRDRLGVKL